MKPSTLFELFYSNKPCFWFVEIYLLLFQSVQHLWLQDTCRNILIVLKVIINNMNVINFTCMTYELVLYFNHFWGLSGRLTIRELHENKVLKVYLKDIVVMILVYKYC